MTKDRWLVINGMYGYPELRLYPASDLANVHDRMLGHDTAKEALDAYERQSMVKLKHAEEALERAKTNLDWARVQREDLGFPSLEDEACTP